MHELIAICSAIAALLASRFVIRRRYLARRLNLAVGNKASGYRYLGVDMANILSNQKLPVSIAPAAGQTPALVTDVIWSVEPAGMGSVVATSPDLFNAEFLPFDDVQGNVTVIAEARNVEGTQIRETLDVTIMKFVPVADRLNLTAGEPQPKA
jgi:hypothetical protein